MKFTLDPGALVLLALAEFLYLRAVWILRGRGYRVPVIQQVSWHFGIGMQAVALVGPVDAYSTDLVYAHMGQHLLLADVAVPFLLIGIRTPVLVFLLPRPILVPLARTRWLRRAFRFARRPLVALPIYMVVLYTWHFSGPFVAALRHPAVHAAQHLSFMAAGVLVWWPALEPKRRRLQGDLWKIPYIFAWRMISMFLGVGFVASQHTFYGAYYHDRARHYGLSPLADQQIAGGIMMSLDIIIMVTGLIYFFYYATVEADAEERRLRAAA